MPIATQLHKHLQLLRAIPRRSKVLLLCLSLLLCALLSMLCLQQATDEHQRQLDAEAGKLQEDLHERLQLALITLDYASELLRQPGSDKLTQLGSLAGQTSARLPFIDYLGWQARIPAEQRSAFEAVQSRQRGQHFVIRDHWPSSDGSWGADNSWQTAATHSSYVPLLMQEPSPSLDQHAMQGLDLLHDPVLGPSLQQAITTATVQVSPPLRIGQHWHLFLLQAIYDSKLPPSNPVLRDEQWRGVMLMNLRLDAMLASSISAHPALQFWLQKPDGSRSEWPSGSARADSSLPTHLASTLLPLPADGYQLQIAQAMQWRQWLGLPLLAIFTGTALLCYLLWLMLALLQRQRHFRQQTLEQLHREREQATVTLHAISDAVLAFDTHYRIHYLNPSAAMLLGLGHRAALGQDVRELVRMSHEFARPGQPDPFTRAMQIRDTAYLPDSSYLTRCSGEKLLVEGSVSPVFDRQAALIGAVLTLRDTAPRRQRMLANLEASERRLRQHEQELARVGRINTMGEMASGIAHEINQPLCAILSYCQTSLSLLEEDEADVQLVRRAMQNAATQAQRAGQVIQRLREFVSKRTLHQNPLDPNQSVSNALALLEYELQQQDIHLEMCFADNPPNIHADNIQLEQVILNLLRNAIDAMEPVRPWGRLTVSTRYDSERVHILISDNGPGIAADLQDKIFDPFFSTKPNGMGLGLAICQTAIENMGGQIMAGNRPGGGAEFVIDLPALTTTAAAAVAGEEV